MKIGMTPHQRIALLFIQAHFEVHGVAPTYSELRRHLGLASNSGIARLLNGLEERGHIRRLKQRRRAIELIQAANHLCPHCNQPLPQKIRQAA